MTSYQETRVRGIVKRCLDGEGVVKWHEPYFIQLQPDKHIHLNFWGSPFETTPESIAPTHTHDYGFTSHIIFGTLYNTRCQVAETEDGESQVLRIDDKDFARFIEFVPTGKRATILRTKVEVNETGATYDMDPRDWHSTRIDAPAISLLDMWDHAPLDYYVLAPLDKTFGKSVRFVEPVMLPALWNQVFAMLELAGIHA